MDYIVVTCPHSLGVSLRAASLQLSAVFGVVIRVAHRCEFFADAQCIRIVVQLFPLGCILATHAGLMAERSCSHEGFFVVELIAAVRRSLGFWRRRFSEVGEVLDASDFVRLRGAHILHARRHGQTVRARHVCFRVFPCVVGRVEDVVGMR